VSIDQQHKAFEIVSLREESYHRVIVPSEQRYTAWGEVRYSSGNTAAKYTYTGQYSYTSDFGVMFYNAHWYDP